ncbi:hypothetical protein WBJ53_06425 [Spirosoma sp. SC4-14]|uniref:hypothetical protein n=1 Tax=Spirosoma sp. SC4-14 TaxID=3128900 RepID=UPI0030D1B700
MELLSGCHHGNRIADSSVPRVAYAFHELTNDTTLFAQPQSLGVLTNPILFEVSGLVASRLNPGYLWVEEDSGNPNEIQLVNPAGQVVARFEIEGATNYDWEDIAIGTGPSAGVPYIYLADIGHNKVRFADKVIYRFPEPSLAGMRLPVDGQITDVETIRLQLPDKAQNAEAMLVDSTANELFILSKGDDSVVYKASCPKSRTQAITMSRLFVLPFKDVTSAALSPDGREILVRTYEKLFYYNRRDGETIAETLKRPPCMVPVAKEQQGEAVGWEPNGDGYFTTSEELDGHPQVIFYYPRKKPLLATSNRSLGPAHIAVSEPD